MHGTAHRERLAAKLLTGGALEAAARDLTAIEDEVQRDRFGNRW